MQEQWFLPICFLAGAVAIAVLYVRLLSGKQDAFAVCSVALGEVGVKSRIKRVIGYKKPMLWVSVACLLLCAVVAVLFLTDPKKEDTPSQGVSQTPQTESSEESEQVRPPYVYISGHYAVQNRYGMCVPDEFSASTSSRREPERQGEQIPFPIYGAEGETLTYSVTNLYPYEKGSALVYYHNGMDQTFMLDGDTGEVVYFNFSQFPAGYEVKTQKSNTYLAKKACRKVIEVLFPTLSPEEYEVVGETSWSRMQVSYTKYKDGIMVDCLRFWLDECGNVTEFRRDGRVTEVLPSYTDEDYIAMAHARLKDFYADKIGIAELKDFEIENKKCLYLRSQACNAIEYDVWLTAVYEDGKEERIGYAFVLPYDADGNAIEVETEPDGMAFLMHGSFAYRVTDGSVEIMTYFGSDTHLVIPDTIEGYPVTKINSRVFAYESGIVSVDLPETLVEIGANAFQECTSLQTVHAKEGLQIIGEEAFIDCTSLAEFTFPSTLLEIGHVAFFRTALREIVLHDGIAVIGGWAFAETKLTEIVIPRTVTEINESAFFDCKQLQKVTFEGDAVADYRVPNSETRERNYTVYFYEGHGFTEPDWNGYRSVMLPDTER